MRKKKGYQMNKHGVTVDDHDSSSAPQMGKTPSKTAMEHAGHEMKMNPPRQLAKTAKKFGKKRARKQKIAIMMSKARKGE